jgi:hypothetical protein
MANGGRCTGGSGVTPFLPRPFSSMKRLYSFCIINHYDVVLRYNAIIHIIFSSLILCIQISVTACSLFLRLFLLDLLLESKSRNIPGKRNKKYLTFFSQSLLAQLMFPQAEKGIYT